MRSFRSLGSLLAVVYLGVACGSPPRQIALPASSKVATSDGKENDHFGISVSLDGERAIVGAHGADDRGNQAGAAYLFAKAGKGWKQEAKLVAYDGGNNKQFGVSVHLDGDRAIVGSREFWRAAGSRVRRTYSPGGKSAGVRSRSCSQQAEAEMTASGPRFD